MKKEKFDKYTEYINAFKVAADELSKQNIDTNDNGIEIKKNKEGEDEPELTNGQKSLVWENLEDTIANNLKDYIFDLTKTGLTVKDFIELFIGWDGNQPVLKVDALTNYLVEINED